jgi:hypothetical protein
MRGLVTLIACFSVGCGAGTVRSTPCASPGDGDDPAARDTAIREVTELLEAHCESGIHTVEEFLPEDGPLLVVGTAGEIMEGRALLEQINATYETRGIEVRHDCSEVQRWVYASPSGDVAWAEEAIRTNARFPGIDVSFPSQRTLIFGRTPEGWRLQYYSLSVRLPDDDLDTVFGVGHQPPGEGGGAGASPGSASAPAE